MVFMEPHYAVTEGRGTLCNFDLKVLTNAKRTELIGNSWGKTNKQTNKH